MASGDDQIKVPKLNSKNYYAWVPRIKTALSWRNFWDNIEREVSSENEDEGDEETVDIAEFSNKNIRARALIMVFIGDEHISEIEDCETALKAWKNLEQIHTDFVLLDTLSYMKMFHLTNSEDMKMQTYLTRMYDSSEKVKKCGFEFTVKQMAGIYLQGLPSEKYDCLVRSIAEYDLTTRTVKSKLLKEEKRQGRAEGKKEPKAILTSRRSQGKSHSNRQDGQRDRRDGEMSHKQNDPGEQRDRSRKILCFSCGNL